jgi:flavin-dependent dehydrogenase
LNKAQVCDVAVIGGGPAGCATALALARRLKGRICIIEPGRGSERRVGETLLPDTRLLLDELGLWEDFLSQGHEVCLGSCSAWGDPALGYNDFVLNPHARGWHLDRQRFDDFLLRRAGAGADTQLINARLTDCADRGPDGFKLELIAGDGSMSWLSPRYVVDASGYRAAFARRVGAQPAFLDRLIFVYGFFDNCQAASSSRLTLLEAAESGWWYAAQLPDRQLAVAFATDPDLLRSAGLSREDRWLAHAFQTQHVATRLDGCNFRRGSLCIRPAASCLLDSVSGGRWLAAGDAAAVYDPLAAQGIHKALSEGIFAANVITRALTRNADVSSEYAAATAERFEEYRINRNYFYAREMRWKHSPFWQRRHQRSDLQGHISAGRSLPEQRSLPHQAVE